MCFFLSQFPQLPYIPIPITLGANSIYKTARKLYSTAHKKLRFFFFAGGASYSPEYYINIRTGIHYFPKGNATIDPGASRFKSGLNRIEEKNDEVRKKNDFPS